MRRKRELAALSAVTDPVVWEERQRAVRALLAKPLLVEAGRERVLVRRHAEWLQLWFSHHAGWELSVDAEACRLVKRPAYTGDHTRPWKDVKSKSPLGRRAYALVCLVLGILMKEGRQLTLKNLADRLGVFAGDPVFSGGGIPIDLSRREVRRDLVHALRALLDWGVLIQIDGSEDAYVTSESTDVLYGVNRAVLSRLLAARQPPSLVAATDFEARLDALWRGTAPATSDDARNREMRTALFRRLLDDPVLYYADLDPETLEYLKKQRPHILAELKKATGLEIEQRAEGIALVDLSGTLTDYRLPEEGTDGQLTLLLATWLGDRIRSASLASSASGETAVPWADVLAETRRLIAVHGKRWRKDTREPGAEAVIAPVIIDRLAALSLVRKTSSTPGPFVIQPLPAIGRYAMRSPEIPASSSTSSSPEFLTLDL